ncbi:MAG: hypothetical protein H6696_19985 [Deferribacteres bacterium]|nr:hypothetical protein [Deferribacteres bacterium]
MNIATKLYPQTIWGENYQGNFDDIINDILEAGINTIIAPVLQGSRYLFPIENQSSPGKWNMVDFQAKCQARGIAFVPEFPLFHDPDTFKNIPQYRPVNKNGDYLTPQNWYHPICPSNTEYMKYRLNFLFEAIEVFDPAIISLDFLQFPYLPGHPLYSTGTSGLPEFCYCDFCKAKFQEFSGQNEPEKYPAFWLEFRQETITYVPVLIAEEIERRGRQTKILAQLPSVPSPGSNTNLQFNTGINFEQWNNIVDVVSPHLYTHQINAENEWALTFFEEIRQTTAMHIIPELDVPFYSVEPEENLQIGELIEYLRDMDIAAISLYHWELLMDNDILRDYLVEISEK